MNILHSPDMFKLWGKFSSLASSSPWPEFHKHNLNIDKTVFTFKTEDMEQLHDVKFSETGINK